MPDTAFMLRNALKASRHAMTADLTIEGFTCSGIAVSPLNDTRTR
jgi:hypothetical protein